VTSASVTPVLAPEILARGTVITQGRFRQRIRWNPSTDTGPAIDVPGHLFAACDILRAALFRSNSSCLSVPT
jgi:hypothetical protein